MKLFFTVSIILFSVLNCAAQLTTLNETFDVDCASSTSASYPTYWSGYCKFMPTLAFAWNCYPVGGRFGTPGFTCNSYYTPYHHDDTAWLFTPKLNLSGNTDHIYLRYDSRYEYSAAKLSLLLSHNYVKYTNPDTSNIDWLDVTGTSTPTVGPDDSLDWITHFVDLTPYKASPLIFAFKYTSTTTFGGRWTIDNIMTTPWALNVKDLEKQLIPITIIGAATTNQLTIACAFAVAGTYKLVINDLMGRELHTETLRSPSGEQNFNFNDLQLAPGMYFVKVSNGITYGAAKIMVQ